jgi:hypothetical protein
MPDANPNICVWIAALAADLHTSLLLTTIDGADAVGGALSVTTVLLDTVLVSAAFALKLIITKALNNSPVIVFFILNQTLLP